MWGTCVNHLTLIFEILRLFSLSIHLQSSRMNIILQEKDIFQNTFSLGIGGLKIWLYWTDMGTH
jgi:hypothetical protein